MDKSSGIKIPILNNLFHFYYRATCFMILWNILTKLYRLYHSIKNMKKY